jgi:hypothetical protein
MVPLPPLAPSPSWSGLTVQRADGAKLPPSAPFLVQLIQITGNTLLDTATLHALVADAQKLRALRAAHAHAA